MTASSCESNYSSPPPPPPPKRLKTLTQQSSSQLQLPISTESQNPEVVPIDRISQLPDTILVHILSLLNNTQQAFSTSILSKRWQNLWALIPVLNFNYYDDRSPSTNNNKKADFRLFLTLVSRVLTRHESPIIRSFELNTPYTENLYPRVTHWLSRVINNGVQDIHLQLQNEAMLMDADLSGAYILPECLYYADSLVKMNLHLCYIEPPSMMSWWGLKKLTFCDSFIEEGAIVRILTGSSNLEVLELVYCKGFSMIDTRCSLSLKTLLICGFAENGCDCEVMQIYAPRIESLILEGYLHPVIVKLVDVSSLKKASVCIESPGADDTRLYVNHQWMLVELLCGLVHVDQLTFGDCCIQDLSACILKVIPFPLSNWKHLTLDSCLYPLEVRAISALLECSPQLEFLTVNRAKNYHDQPIFPADLPNNIRQLRQSMKCLKSVKIVHSKTGDHDELESVMAFAHFLLSNARSLNLMLIKK